MFDLKITIYQLGELKSIHKPSFTLLHYLHKLISNHFPNILGSVPSFFSSIHSPLQIDFPRDLPHIEAASRISLLALLSDISQLQAEIQIIKQELQYFEEHKLQEDKDDKFQTVMTVCKVTFKYLLID